MKKFKYFTIVFVALLLNISCSSDNSHVSNSKTRDDGVVLVVNKNAPKYEKELQSIELTMSTII